MAADAIVGPELGHIDGEWYQLAIQYLEAALQAPTKVANKYPKSLYWLSRYLDSEVGTMWSLRRRAAELLRPALAARIEASRASTSSTSSYTRKGQRQYEDCIQWLLDSYDAKAMELTPDQLAQDLFIIIVASIHGISGTALALLFDCIEHPNEAEEVRQEIERVQNAHGGIWTRQALAELQVMDSFMRESARVHSLTQSMSTIFPTCFNIVPTSILLSMCVLCH